jgi:hypothetical protein
MVGSPMHVALLFGIPIEPRATAPSRSLDLPGPAASGERRRELSPNAPRWFKNKSDKPVRLLCMCAPLQEKLSCRSATRSKAVPRDHRSSASSSMPSVDNSKGTLGQVSNRAVDMQALI